MNSIKNSFLLINFNKLNNIFKTLFHENTYAQSRDFELKQSTLRMKQYKNHHLYFKIKKY